MTEQLKQQAISEQNARFAIDGAISFGRQGINKPPSDDHWLMEYWQIGQSLAALDAAPSEQTRNQAVHDLWTLKRNYDVATVFDGQGNKISDMYGKEAEAVVEAHNKSVAIRALKDEQSKTAEPADSAQASERFYFDHGLWHDRATGRHLYTQDQYDQEKQAAFKDGYDKRNEELALAAQNAPAQPVPEAEKSVPTWQEAERISDVHEVNMALENFAHDSTADNAAGLVLAVLIAAAPQGEQS